MYVFELIWPGTWLDEPSLDEKARRQVESLFYTFSSDLIEAAIALTRFEEEHIQRVSAPRTSDSPEESAEREQRLRIESDLEAKLPADLTHEARWAARQDIGFQAEAAVLRARWQAGQVPENYLFHMVFLYAKSFLYSMDSVGKTLTALAEIDGLPPAIIEQRDAFYSALPTLTGVRDTSHHLEDRARGLDRRGQPLTLKPVVNPMISAPGGGVLILNSLNNNRFGSTMNDGEFGEVEVSPATVAFAQAAIQGTLDALRWKGPRRYEPSR
jgi:hypothetical protein